MSLFCRATTSLCVGSVFRFPVVCTMSFPVFLNISYILYFFNDEWCLLELYSSAELIRTLGEVGVNGPWMKLRMTSCCVVLWFLIFLHLLDYRSYIINITELLFMTKNRQDHKIQFCLRISKKLEVAGKSRPFRKFVLAYF